MLLNGEEMPSWLKVTRKTPVHYIFSPTNSSSDHMMTKPMKSGVVTQPPSIGGPEFLDRPYSMNEYFKYLRLRTTGVSNKESKMAIFNRKAWAVPHTPTVSVSSPKKPTHIGLLRSSKLLKTTCMISSSTPMTSACKKDLEMKISPIAKEAAQATIKMSPLTKPKFRKTASRKLLTSFEMHQNIHKIESEHERKSRGSEEKKKNVATTTKTQMTHKKRISEPITTESYKRRRSNTKPNTTAPNVVTNIDEVFQVGNLALRSLRDNKIKEKVSKQIVEKKLSQAIQKPAGKTPKKVATPPSNLNISHSKTDSFIEQSTSTQKTTKGNRSINSSIVTKTNESIDPAIETINKNFSNATNKREIIEKKKSQAINKTAGKSTKKVATPPSNQNIGHSKSDSLIEQRASTQKPTKGNRSKISSTVTKTTDMSIDPVIETINNNVSNATNKIEIIEKKQSQARKKTTGNTSKKISNNSHSDSLIELRTSTQKASKGDRSKHSSTMTNTSDMNIDPFTETSLTRKSDRINVSTKTRTSDTIKNSLYLSLSTRARTVKKRRTKVEKERDDFNELLSYFSITVKGSPPTEKTSFLAG